MSFSTLATVAVGLALAGVTVAGLAGILVCLRRREQANRAFGLVLLLFATATASAFGAAARSGNDLQVETRAVLSLAASAERTVHARSGRYTTSIADLERISPALADQISLDAAHVSAGPRAPIRRVRLRVWIGASTPAVRVLTSRARNAHGSPPGELRKRGGGRSGHGEPHSGADERHPSRDGGASGAPKQT
jgi:hypothetical protein